MTDIQYGIIGLVVLAVAMNIGRIMGLLKNPQAAASPTAPPTVRLIGQVETAGPTGPPDVAAIAALFNQSVAAEAHSRAVRRSVEGMIDHASKQVQLTWVSPTGSTETDGPKV